MFIGICFNVLMAVFYECSLYSLLGIVYQVQMFMLVPCLNIDVGEDVIDFYRYIHHILFSFDIWPSQLVFFGYDNAFDSFDYSQSNSYLYLMYFKSGSSMVNTYDLLWTAILVLSFFLIVVLPSFLISKELEPDSNRYKFFKTVGDFILFRLLVRILLVSTIFLGMASLPEIINFDRIADGFVSYVYACVIAGV